jgi:PhnB protein
MQLNPYLNFSGDCEEAFRFYERSLGARIECRIPTIGTERVQQLY